MLTFWTEVKLLSRRKVAEDRWEGGKMEGLKEGDFLSIHEAELDPSHPEPIWPLLQSWAGPFVFAHERQQLEINCLNL